MWSPFRKAQVATLVAVFVGATVAGCGGKPAGVSRTPIAALDDATLPAKLAAELVKLGGAHVRVTATFRVDTARPHPADGTKPASPATVTTTTEVWLDKHGNYRLVDTNDQDGGREVATVGAQIAVALRYGKMMRRTADSAEAARYLAEALGAPWSAWEVVRRQVEVQGREGNYRLGLSSKRSGLPAGFPTAEKLRAWREGLVVEKLDGRATLSPDGRALLAFDCKAAYRAERDGVGIEGDLAVSMQVDQVGKTADVVLPAGETLESRQRTVLEERALLGDISAAAAPARKKP
jgi:hypothetical protein